MEYVEGRTLRQMIEGRELDVDGAIEMALQICAGLKEAHQIGIIHRDVKPENVIVDAQGRARLLDFGIARHRSSPPITGAGKMVGTPAYMSPEQALGEGAGPQSDLFALGVVLYEMLVGDYPFSGTNPLRLLKAILKDSPRPIPEDRQDIPRALRNTVFRALMKDPQDRYPNAEAMRSDLLAARQQLPAMPPPQAEGELRQTEPTVAADVRAMWVSWWRRIPVPAIGLFAVLAVVIVLLLVL